ncbi:putative toxin-antitoxin system toxin component, PIN family [Oceanispirochaeta sp.]|jgi:putative PIN family toxin of toxin-antitoxin system|uniref:putative toxin-antitoxin system toxin component, PIN family n=1 Tax=Oceanispirochaeta sp. TaxID=2035350 RepID=UPI0026191D0C|nr:putative toxin-antitoxin system toxin component, PIN family [Oceanispirochaeta sp.]MDA3955252.1 putative toxin-antitoxin system toxin component, PIN family [Oceanispirochaeta sp.]
MNIVLDTNVLISGLLNPNGFPAQVLNLIINKRIKLIIDTRIISEYSEVLRHPKFKFRDESINPLLDFIKIESESIIPEPSFIDFPDPDDKIFWEVAKSGNALYIISGNTKHFPKDPMVVTPAVFISLYQKTKIDQK